MARFRGAAVRFARAADATHSIMADIGLGQVRANDTVEPPLFTSGDDLVALGNFLGARTHYSAQEVLDYLLA